MPDVSEDGSTKNTEAGQPPHTEEVKVVNVVAVSTPEHGPDENGGFTFPVMENIVKCMNTIPFLSIGFDWAGSNNAYAADKGIWDQLFASSGIITQYKTAVGDEKTTLKEELRSQIVSTRWYAAYKSQVRQAVRDACLKKYPVWMVCIDGGPMSEIEQMEMPKIAQEIKEDLKKLRVNNPSITIKRYPNYQAFEVDIQALKDSSARGRRRRIIDELDTVERQQLFNSLRMDMDQQMLDGEIVVCMPSVRSTTKLTGIPDLWSFWYIQVLMVTAGRSLSHHRQRWVKTHRKVTFHRINGILSQS